MRSFRRIMTLANVGGGVLDDVGKQFADRLKEQHAKIQPKRAVKSAPCKTNPGPIAALHLLAQPFHRRRQPKFVKHRRAELEGQRSAFVDRLLKKDVKIVKVAACATIRSGPNLSRHDFCESERAG